MIGRLDTLATAGKFLSHSGSSAGATLALLSWSRNQFFLDAPNFVFHRLIAIDTSTESHACGNSWHACIMQGLMALLHGGEDPVLVAFDVGAVGVKVGLEAGCGQDTLTDCDFL